MIVRIYIYLQEYIRREVKPRSKQQLIDGIKAFWETMDVAKCRRYIGHLQKVIPKMIELNGDATGYWYNVITYMTVSVWDATSY